VQLHAEAWQRQIVSAQRPVGSSRFAASAAGMQLLRADVVNHQSRSREQHDKQQPQPIKNTKNNQT
jgi:hypothetical protein